MSSLSMHRYAAVSGAEHGDSVENLDENPPTGPSVSSGSSSKLRTALLLLIGAIAGALISSILQSHSTTMPTIAATGELEKLHRLLSFPQEKVTFQENQTFADPPSPQTDAAWMELIGPTEGFIALEHPETYGLPPGRPIKEDTRQIYGVTMFHQLHCLMMLRDMHYGLLQGKYNASDFDSTDGSERPFVVEHTEHCFDFLQQSIRCAGLVQIELPQGSRKNIFNGWGTEHTCPSWSAIMGFMETYQAPGRGGGDNAAEHSHDAGK